MLKITVATAFAFIAAVSAASAQERTIITSAPSAQEYVDLLFQQAPPAEIKIRGIKARGIQLTGTTAVTAQVPASAPVPQTAAQVQPATAPAPAPVPAAALAQPVILAAPVNFAYDSDEIPADFAAHLVNLAEALKRPEAQGKLLIVSGHTDSLGSDTYNLALSIRRAYSIQSFLIAQGVAPSQLVATGKGEQQLIAGHEADHALNRRVEFQVGG